MNIAVFADIHGRILLCFKLCARWEQETGEKIDLVLQCGDMGVFPDESKLDRATIKHAKNDPTELGFLNDFVCPSREVEQVLARTKTNLVFVRGNHEDHECLDALERQDEISPVFPVDCYKRLYCLKTGKSFHFHAGNEAIQILSIGRIGPPSGKTAARNPKYIQEYERRRINSLPKKMDMDVLLTHASAKDFVTPGYGMEEIRTVLDIHKPCYHFFGHTGKFLKKDPMLTG